MPQKTIFMAKPNSYTAFYPEYKSWHENAYAIIEPHARIASLDLPDIWVRDFLPVQNTKTGELFLFNYDPLFENEKEKTHYKKCRIASEREFKNAKKLDIWMDGGNLICSGKYGFALETNGTDISAKRKELEHSLGIDIIILPYRLKVPDEDPCGHIDGVMQILGENTLMISAPLNESEEREQADWIKSIKDKTGNAFEIAYLPNGCVKSGLRTKIDARGLYANFLETDNAVFAPQYNLPEDAAAIDAIQKHTSKPVIPIDCDEISKHGGSLHCLTNEYLIQY